MTVEVISDVTNVTVTQTGPLNVEVSTTGLQGASGPSNVLTIDTVTPLAPSATPTVILGGAAPAQTISFGIPVGAQILQGTTAPAGALGQVGFWYINTSTWDVYEKTAAAVWTSRGNIKGATGNTGPAPNLTIGTVTSAAAGSSPTATITGTNPNYSLNLNLPLANWTIGTTTSLVPGSAATSSITGTALNPILNIGIPRGAAILNGTTAPASGTGSQGDWYFNTVTSDLYEKTSPTVWTLRQNLKGATGSTGNTGPANTLSIGTVTTGAPGSSASATITGTAPTQTLNLTLPTGATGPAGPAPNMGIGTVTTLAAGASATATITGTNPNYSLNLGLPQGLKGDIGAQWYAGSGTPGAGTGVVGDFYLVASGTGVGDVYKKTGASAWTLQGNIRGQAGSGDVESVNGVLPVGGNVTLAWTDIAGLIPASKLPSLATVETYTVATQADMLALSAQRGDLAIRTDLDETYILSGDDPAVLANWTQLLTDGGNVRLTGNQTITGTKTFSSAPVVPDASWTIAKTSGLQAALDSKAPLASPTFTGTVSGITKAMVGLGNVANAAQVELTGAQTIAGVKTFSSAPVVPDASFTIAKTSGLQSALDGKAASSHTHAATEIVSGTFDIARIPTGTTGTTVALGNHLHTGVYEPLIAAGTTAQYRRGDNTWQTLDVAAVAGAAPLESPTFTGTVGGITKAMVGLANVNNAAQVELTGNQTIAGTKTFSSAPILSSLTASTVLVLDASKNIVSSAVTATELGYLDGVTSAIQTQLNGKAATTHGHALTDANITGVLPIAQVPTGTTSSTVALGNHGHALTDANITGILPYAQLPVGTVANTVAAGNDSRITGAEQASNKSTSTSLGTSDTLYPSQNAVKSYVDSSLVDLGTYINGLYVTRDYGGQEKHANAPATTGTVTLNVGLASIFSITPTGNVTFAFSGLSGTNGKTITIIINTNATPRTITWPASVDWGTGSAPTMTANKTTIVTLLTVNGGTKIHARAA